MANRSIEKRRDGVLDRLFDSEMLNNGRSRFGNLSDVILDASLSPETLRLYQDLERNTASYNPPEKSVRLETGGSLNTLPAASPSGNLGSFRSQLGDVSRSLVKKSD